MALGVLLADSFHKIQQDYIVLVSLRLLFVDEDLDSGNDMARERMPSRFDIDQKRTGA